MNVKAEAYQEYNQAAIYDKLLTSMPEIMRAMAAPLANVDKITVVSTGGDSSGMNKITGDLTKMAAQVPALFETLSGMSMTDLLSKVQGIGDKTPKPPSRRSSCRRRTRGRSRLEQSIWLCGAGPVRAKSKDALTCAATKLKGWRHETKMTNKYMGVGTALGTGVGAAIGAATHQMGVWVALGAGIGLALGVVFGGTKPSK